MKYGQAAQTLAVKISVGCRILCGYQRVRVLSPWNAKNTKTSHSAATYWSGIIQPYAFINTKSAKR
jgi:hypothetical protein